jgi:hypothetical protein
MYALSMISVMMELALDVTVYAVRVDKLGLAKQVRSASE